MNEMMLYRRLRDQGMSHSEADEILETRGDALFDQRRDDEHYDAIEAREMGQ